jgi:transposase InsO family protein
MKMPWQEVEKVELRRVFVERVKSGIAVAEACREFGVSRPTGYKWLRRYEAEGVEGLRDRSRCPRRVALTDPRLVAAVVAERSRRKWGARKIRKRLETLGEHPPSERTVNRILRREGLQEERRRPPEPPQRFERSRPNALWQMDHKSAVRGKWRSRAVPLLVVDDHSRYLFCLQSLPDKGLESTWPRLWEIFGEFGLPEAMLSDNDIIFAGRNGPSQLESRLLRLGIEVIHGRPYHPQTQGKVERLNGTLERELLRDGSFETALELQAGFDRFRREYNFERPHEALDLEVPASRYVPSPRRRPPALPPLCYGAGALLRKVEHSGRISFRGERIEVGGGIIGDWVEVREADFGYEVYYGAYRILGFVPGGARKAYRGYRRIPGGSRPLLPPAPATPPRGGARG